MAIYAYTLLRAYVLMFVYSDTLYTPTKNEVDQEFMYVSLKSSVHKCNIIRILQTCKVHTKMQALEKKIHVYS